MLIRISDNSFMRVGKIVTPVGGKIKYKYLGPAGDNYRIKVKGPSGKTYVQPAEDFGLKFV